MKAINTVKISSISTGFIEVPGEISLNLYTQGCSLQCKDCHNPDLQPFSGGETITIQDIKNILDEKSLPTWIAWLGGEPTDQPDGFKSFNKIFKEYGYGVCLYTGKYFSDITDLLDDVDIVIDGPWEGIGVSDPSTNQKVYYKEENWQQVDFNNLKNLLGGVSC